MSPLEAPTHQGAGELGELESLPEAFLGAHLPQSPQIELMVGSDLHGGKLKPKRVNCDGNRQKIADNV